MLARVLLAQDRPRQALALLQRLHTAAAAQARLGSVIELRAVQALALAASGQEPDAVAALAEALTLACPQGYVRVFTDEGAPMAALLGGWSRRSGQNRLLPVASHSTAWPGCCARSTGNPTCPALAGAALRRCPAWSRR